MIRRKKTTVIEKFQELFETKDVWITDGAHRSSKEGYYEEGASIKVYCYDTVIMSYSKLVILAEFFGTTNIDWETRTDNNYESTYMPDTEITFYVRSETQE